MVEGQFNIQSDACGPHFESQEHNATLAFQKLGPHFARGLHIVHRCCKVTCSMFKKAEKEENEEGCEGCMEVFCVSCASCL